MATGVVVIAVVFFVCTTESYNALASSAPANRLHLISNLIAASNSVDGLMTTESFPASRCKRLASRCVRLQVSSAADRYALLH